MLFLIQYHRETGKLKVFEPYTPDHADQAKRRRMELESASLTDKEISEIVILEAEDEAAIRKSHSRYFETLESIAKQLQQIP